MKSVAFTIVQCVWGAVQTLVGFMLFLAVNLAWLSRKRRLKIYRWNGAVVTEWGYDGSVSLGLFIFVSRQGMQSQKNLLPHEYGHCIQSLILGVMYFPVIGLPSLIWAGLFRNYRKRHNRAYDWFYTERWANALAKWRKL